MAGLTTLWLCVFQAGVGYPTKPWVGCVISMDYGYGVVLDMGVFVDEYSTSQMEDQTTD